MPSKQGKQHSNKPNVAEHKGNLVRASAISFPKGVEAIHGVSEKFDASPEKTGAGSMSVPIGISGGRGGFCRQLMLLFDSGSGNGPFGLCWILSPPAITRKPAKVLPQYRNAEESNVLVLSGSVELVPVLVEHDRSWHPDPFDSPDSVAGYRIDRYRPRVEGLFARIERRTELASGHTHWRSISKDNHTTPHGKRAGARITDRADPTHAVSWLISERYDNAGNSILYIYTRSKIPLALSAHPWRTSAIASRQAAWQTVILRTSSTENQTLRQANDELAQRNNWMFELVLDYGEYHAEDSVGQTTEVSLDDGHRPWPVRQDSFSCYRAALEVCTYRLRRRALMFHDFATELGTPDHLVSAAEFRYSENPVASFLNAVSHAGYVQRDNGRNFKKSLPPVEFEYSEAAVSSDISEIKVRSLGDLPQRIYGSRCQWVDLDGEGLSGILTEQGDVWYYKLDLGGSRFGALETVASKPSLADLRAGSQQLLDLAGDRLPFYLVAFYRPIPDLFERVQDQNWDPFITSRRSTYIY